MKLLIFGIAFTTLGAIGQAKTANIEFGEAKIRSEYSSRAVYGKALLRPWEYDWRRHTNLPLPSRHNVRCHPLTINLHLLINHERRGIFTCCVSALSPEAGRAIMASCTGASECRSNSLKTLRSN